MRGAIKVLIGVFLIVGFMLIAGEDTSSDGLTIRDISSAVIGFAMWYVAYKMSKIGYRVELSEDKESVTLHKEKDEG